MTAPYQHEPWEGDPADAALRQWIVAWRSHVEEDTAKPSLRFALHIGGEAVRLQSEGVSRVELVRMFAAVGHDGVCICGLRPAELPGRPPMLETRGKRRARRVGQA